MSQNGMDAAEGNSPPHQTQYELAPVVGWFSSWKATATATHSTSPSQSNATETPPKNYGSVLPSGQDAFQDDSESPAENADYQHQPMQPTKTPLDIEDAMEQLGMGNFQFQILVAAGLCFAADAMEILLLSFLSVILTIEWQLEGHQTDLLISVVFAGAMIGTLILSPLGDKLGRRPVFSLTAAIIAVFGIGTGFCHNYIQLLIARFMVGFGVGGLVVPFDTLAEFIPAEYRGSNLLYIEFFWTFGTLLVPVCAWLTLGRAYEGEDEEGSWRLFCILCAIPCCVATALGVWLVPESPRWLLTKGKHEEALIILRQAAARNGHDPMEVFPEGTFVTQEEEEHNASLLDLFSPKWCRITILLWVAWFGLAFLYYGAILAVSIVFTTADNVVRGEDGSYQFDYLAIFISASSEIVGLIMVLLTIDRWGRIPTQTFTYVLGGVSCLLLGYAAHWEASRATLVILAFLARMAMMGATCTTWVSTSEVLTTDIRTTGHGYANAMARVGGFFCPYIINGSNSLNHVGLFLFVVSVVSAITVWQLPETGRRYHHHSETPGKSLEDEPMSSKEGLDYTRFVQ